MSSPRRKKTKSYSELRKIWYKKLKDSGFKDVEQDDAHMKVWANDATLRTSAVQWRAKESYFQLATTFLNEYEFETERDHLIWEYHANGVSVREMEIIFSKVKIPLKKSGIFKVVDRLAKIMKQMYVEPKN